MKKLQFCPACGNASLSFVQERKWYCSSCSFSLYHNIAAAVAVLIRCGDELFFTRRNQDPKVGFLDLAGGFVDPHETAEQTCIRELKEELHIDFSLENLQYLGSQPNEYPYGGIVYRTLDLFYLLEVKEKFLPIFAQDEISEGVWIKIKDLNIEHLAFESQKTFLKIFKTENQLIE